MHYSPAIKRNVDTNINLMLTMLLGGLWHGASLNFIIWGGLNGIGLMVYKFWRKISPWEAHNNWAATIWKIAITFTFITFTRVFFRGESIEIVKAMLNQISFAFTFSVIPDVLLAYKWVFAVMLFGFVIHWLSENLKEKIANWFIGTPIWAKVVIAAITVIIVYQSISSEMQAFIYFQF
ncbi:MAG TPA: hypothetical protein VLQ91_14195, partial [Draconibacterium sp.]|nr:hypothetical protein [Draconibacterium sp.]